MKRIFNQLTILSALLGLLWSAILSGCSFSTIDEETKASDTDNALHISKEPFGKTTDGKPVDLYTLINGDSMVVKITNYGGIITSLVTLDKNGNPGDVVLGFDSLSPYQAEHPHFGPLIGRYSSFIDKGRFTLDGVEYKLATNAGDNHLHGGDTGFGKRVWDAEEIRTDDEVGIRLTYVSPDGEEGYPGTLTATVTYTLSDQNDLKINYEARTDKQTHVNLTNHSYFNLTAGQADNILQHELTIYADRYAVVDKNMIPTGELRQVKGTPADFTQATPIGARIEQVPGGYDHNYVLKMQNNDSLVLAATVYDPASGRYMEVHTTQEGIEFASANWLDGSLTGKADKKYTKNYGFLLYPQHLPDSPNHPDFPSTVLEPGEVYSETTIYKFSAEESIPESQ